MKKVGSIRNVVLASAVLFPVIGFSVIANAQNENEGKGSFSFSPISSSVSATPGGNPDKPLVLPSGYLQKIIASEPGYAGNPDMNTLNETGPEAGRYLYQTHEIGSPASVSVIDLKTNKVKTIAQSADWASMDGIVWSPWGTIIATQERGKAFAYEINPKTGESKAIPAFGARSNEGIRFDSEGNLYGISEQHDGHIFKFVPDHKGDLSSGQLYALKVTDSTPDRTGKAVWLPLDREEVQVDSHAAATEAGATNFDRPEDIEIGTSTGNDHEGMQTMYVALTGEDRVIAIDLHKDEAKVRTYVQAGVNAPADFQMPDNLALDKNGDLFITEDPGGDFAHGKTKGDDIWAASPPKGDDDRAKTVNRFATLTDSEAEPTGIYFDKSGKTLYVNIQHRGGDGLDKTLAITKK
jgi:sugar lactone lactonase YvrE